GQPVYPAARRVQPVRAAAAEAPEPLRDVPGPAVGQRRYLPQSLDDVFVEEVPSHQPQDDDVRPALVDGGQGALRHRPGEVNELGLAAPVGLGAGAAQVRLQERVLRALRPCFGVRRRARANDEHPPDLTHPRHALSSGFTRYRRHDCTTLTCGVAGVGMMACRAELAQDGTIAPRTPSLIQT